MGQVYLAEQAAVGRKVALKVIHKDLAHDREMIARFFNEARAVTRIGHEHIVEIYDLGLVPGGEYFIVMEYLAGENLAQAMADTLVLETSRALHIAAQVADALGAAHRNGIVHRDLKPDNVMLTSVFGDPDYVKVLDFGLAKMFSGMDGQPLTARGVIVGTPQYMAPEACETGKHTDHRADIYSLGILLFQMCTGDVPFDGRTMGEVLIQQVTRLPPAPRGLNAEIPPAVEQIILRCLGKTPEARFQTMEELRAALLDPDRYLASSPPIMPAAPLADSDKARTLIRARPGTLDERAAPVDEHAPRSHGPRDTLTNLAKPVMPANRTMRIASPPPVKRRAGWLWPSLGLGLLIGLLVLVSSLSGASEDADSAARVETDARHPDAARPEPTDAGDAGMPDDAAAGHATGDDPDSQARTVRIHFKTEPAGAKIIDPSGLVLGVTPTTIEWPRDGRERVLVFRHRGTEDREKTVVADHDATVEIKLERKRVRPEPEDPEPE